LEAGPRPSAAPFLGDAEKVMTRKRSFNGKVVVITGAAAGVGRAAAMRFAGEGAKLGLISRDEVALAALSEEIRAAGGEPETAAIDVSDAEAVFAAAEQFEQRLGPIDLWVNDAMLTVFSPVSEITPDEFRRVTEVTYLGVVYGCMAALKKMRARDGGQIINIGSALAYRGIPLQSAYCGAKHAIRGFTSSLRAELLARQSGIGVSIIELPAMNTPQFEWARTHMSREPQPMGAIYQPEVAAAGIFRAAQTGAREYWIGWSTLLTIVGNMIAPELMDWYLARTAIEGQESTQPVDLDRKDNLMEPVTALHRVHGAFDSRANAGAPIFSGVGARAVIVAGGASLFFLLGGLAARLIERRQDTPRAAASFARLPARSARDN
jgi:NAD(P)-dependent dehydrogenase (short-subunit alcohol dehydrogenase family)